MFNSIFWSYFCGQKRREEIAEVEVVDNGKSITEARLDVDSARLCIEYFAGLATAMAGLLACHNYLLVFNVKEKFWKLVCVRKYFGEH